MKFYFTSLSLTTPIDGVVQNTICNYFEQASKEDCDYVGLVITYMDKFVLNENELALIKHKPFVIFDYVEYGWDKSPAHIFGINTLEYSELFGNKEYIKLGSVVKEANVKCYFKRELHKNIKSSFPLFPIEYTSQDYDTSKIDTLQQYSERPIDIFFNWGWSNPSRPALHGAFYQFAESIGLNVISNPNDFYDAKRYEPNRPLILTTFTPHYHRMALEDVFKLQSQSKISISLNGCGVKCFRHSEASVNSLMAIQENKLEWTYEWGNENAIVLPHDSELAIKKLIRMLQNVNHLYEKYLKGIETNNLYKTENYINELRRRIESC